MEATEIRQRVRIEDVIARSGVELIGKGRYLRGKEHDSLVVDCKAGFFNWNSRGIHGDQFTWIEKTQNKTFTEALAILSDGVFMPLTELPIALATPDPEPEPLPQDLHWTLHRQLDAASRDWWHSKGLTDATIDRYRLGVYEHERHGLCYTIPIINNRKLANIRLRLANPEKPGDKYRPWSQGRGQQLFMRDELDACRTVVLWAGEIKAMIGQQYHIPSVSTTGGCGYWNDEWTQLLPERVYVIFDEKETENASKIARRIAASGRTAKVCVPQGQADEWLLARGIAGFQQLLKRAK